MSSTSAVNAPDSHGRVFYFPCLANIGSFLAHAWFQHSRRRQHPVPSAMPDCSLSGSKAPRGAFLLCFCLLFSYGCGAGDSGADNTINEARFAQVSAEGALALIAEHQDDPRFAILDVRTPAEFSAEHIRNAANIDFSAPHFGEELGNLDKEKAYLVYCGSGARSEGATGMMRDHGFTEVYNLVGGMNALKQLGRSDLPLVSCGCNQPGP